jgi:hypothetical protein
MTSKETFVKHFEKWRPTLYNEAKHIALLYEVFAEEESVYAFCDEALITRKTFYNWLTAHEKFKEAYDIALCIGARKFEKYPKTAVNFNYPYWSAVMKNRYQYFKTRIETKHKETPANRLEAVWHGISNGELSIQEATQLASLAVTQANIENGTTDNSNSIRQMSTEQLKEKLDQQKERLAVVNSLIDKG